MWIDVEGGKTFINTGGKTYDAANQSLIFIHGSGLDQSVWALQNRYFAHHGYNALAVDLPGHGKSEGLARIDTIEAYGAWIAAVVTALGAKDHVLVGHSMGSLIALDAATRTDPTKLILMGAADAIPVHPSLLSAAADDVGGAASFMAATGFGPRGHRGPSAVPGNNLMANGQRLFEHGGDHLLHDDLKACDSYKNGLESAGRIGCPTLLVLGQLDKMTPAKRGGVLADSLSSAQKHVLPATGHMVMLERPQETNRLVSAFLAA